MHRPLVSPAALLLALLATSPAAAQYISLKTVPVAAGDQFLVFPSQNLGMGGVSIALDDDWLDPFVNPAKGSRIGESRFFALPTHYSVSQNAGSATTLTAGGLFGGKAFGGGMVALQQLKSGEQFFGPVRLADIAILPPNALSQQSATNKYAFLMLGSEVGDGFTVGASAFFSDLNGIDGVEHLYALSRDIDEAGSSQDVRLGLTKALTDGSVLEAIALYNRFDATHVVTYVDWVLVDSVTWQWEEQARVETNADKTNTWGLHLGFRRPVGAHGWRVGGSLTGNYKSHPKIPNYEIVNIPRDPGHSTALDIGIGVAKQQGATTFGMDVVYEPAWSSTWAEAAGPVPTVGGDTIPSGGRTVENEFRFSNAQVRMGVTQQVGPAAFQAGLELRAYDYHLDQWDNVTDEFRRQDEQWMEWTPTWGARVRFPGFEVRYIGRVTTGTGRPGIAWTGIVAERAADAGFANDIVVPPGGPLTLQEVHVWTHQLSVAVPIR